MSYNVIEVVDDEPQCAECGRPTHGGMQRQGKYLSRVDLCPEHRTREFWEKHANAAFREAQLG